MKDVLLKTTIVLFSSSVCFGFSFGFSSEVSPEVVQEMSNKKITNEQVCKGTGNWGGEKCNSFYTISLEDIASGVEFKKFEMTCAKVDGKMHFGKKSSFIDKRAKDVSFCQVPDRSGRYNSRDDRTRYTFRKDDRRFNSYVEKIESKKRVKLESDNKDKIQAEKRAAFIEAENKAKIEDKIQAEKVAKEVNTRIKKLGVSEAYIINFVNRSGYCKKDNGYAADNIYEPLSNSDIDVYLKCKGTKQKSLKEQQATKRKNAKEYAAYEKKAKIKTGKQYVCSDGYDSWILKYNGERITFGDVGMFRNIIGRYQQNKYDNEQLAIDRLKGTVTYRGNKLTCKKR